jgi:DNA polymerase-4
MLALPYDTIPNIPMRRVMHCDLDCFFAAVEELDDPALAGRPVIVGGDPDRRGVVSTANYAARRYGIHSAMAAALARRLCPQAVFLRPRFDRYRELSRRVMAILDDYFLVREQVSIDEAYGELPPAERGCRPAEQIARAIKARVHAETGLTISVGVARGKSLAKLASDLSKPDGCLIVRPGSELAFLRPLPVGRLGGVGPHTRERLERIGITTVGQLAARGERELVSALGKHGRHLWLLANARDDRPVVGEHGPPKSISRERTYERDIADIARAAEQLRLLAGKVARDTAEECVLARSVHIKIKWSDFRLMTRQRSLAAPVADEAPIAEAALALLHTEVAPLLDGTTAIRLLGVGLGGIVPLDAETQRGGIVQLSLWER